MSIVPNGYIDFWVVSTKIEVIVLAFYTRIKDLREDNDKTQKEIAQLLETTQPQYSRYEAGERELPMHHLVTLCKYYNVSADYILGLPRNLPYGHSKTGG